ncbi:hypothetical protein C9374_002154 [Naegleria lovaniensis]|uniref:Uncharacterized protein n=1 Tax=Naegleria lovaniensis TaxID=51637 RepID=A0AA88GVY3_NAELO|nr:uncharacterized protein C9374_002154 [Naegleria lovaniensis]KAG2387119.1 hypothetical protein C9374_002154 [Naegleria lovaniensis]
MGKNEYFSSDEIEKLKAHFMRSSSSSAVSTLLATGNNGHNPLPHHHHQHPVSLLPLLLPSNGQTSATTAMNSSNAIATSSISTLHLLNGNHSVVNAVRSEIIQQQHQQHKHSEFSDSNLVALVKDLGYTIMSTVDAFSRVVENCSNLNERTVGELIGMMAMNHTGLQTRADNGSIVSFLQSIGSSKVEIKENASSWNLDNFVTVMKQKDLNWKQVVACLDHPGFKLKDQKGLAMIVTIYKKITGEKLPLDVFVCRKWNNNDAQLSFILLALDAPPDIIDFSSDKLRHVDISFLPSHKNQNTTWGTIDLVETLLNLADIENINAIKRLFEAPMKQCPEQFLLALAQCNPINILLRQEVISQIVPIFVKPHKNSFSVLHKFSEVNQPLLISTLSETYRKDPTQLRRILDIAQELKILDAILDSRPFRFAIEIAILASKRDHLNLELWLLNNMERHGNEFVQEVINYLTDAIPTLKDKTSQQQATFTSDTAKIFFKCLDKARNLIVAEIFEQAYQLYQALDENLKREIATTEFQLSPEIETKTNQFFLSMFHGEITVEVGVEKLKEMKLSKTRADQEMFACVIHNLFDEYRFFSQYPENSLRVMAKLFGLIIQHNVIVAKTLKYGLICVLQALSSPDIKLFQFGLIALSQFKTRVSEWPQFCAHLRTKIPQAFQHIPDLAQYVAKSLSLIETQLPSDQYGMPGIQNTAISSPPTSISPQPNVMQQQFGTSSTFQQPSISTTPPPQISTSPTPQIPPSATLTPTTDPQTPTKTKKDEEKDKASPGIGFQLDISTLTKNVTTQEIEAPEPELADKMKFAINNLSQINLNEKSNELKNLLSPNLYPYIARYIVVNRASLEPNFHLVYAKMLSTLKLEELDKHVLKQTYIAVNALLHSERITTSLSERSLLKNLGSWLGLQTLAKNKPVLHKDLDLKSLLFEAYESGRLIVVIPFVCKILNHCAKSKVFTPPNPWVMGIVSLLVEIHAIPELKLNLKFEVEMLCKTLKLTISQVEQQNKEKEDYIPLLQGRSQLKYNNPDIHGPTSAVEPLAPIAPGKSEKLFNISQVTDTGIIITDLQDQVKIAENLSIFREQPELRKLVVVALDQTIREIIAPFVKRAVTIACRTTTETIIKDFIAEPDYNKMHRAANLMVANLASKLAVVSCKDILKNNLQNHLRTLFEAASINPSDPKLKTVIDQIVTNVSADNVNVGCAYVGQAARDKGMLDITEALQSELELRKSYASGAVMNYTNYTMPTFVQRLPEMLAPKSGLHRSHVQVYEDFERKTIFEQPREDMLPYNVAVDQAKLAFASMMEYFNQVKTQLPNISYVPAQSRFYENLNKIRSILRRSVQGGETAEALCMDVFYKLYDTDINVIREACVMVLSVLREMESESSMIQVTNLWKELTPNQKLDNATLSLIRVDLLDLVTLDNELLALVADLNHSKNAIPFYLRLIQRLVILKSTLTVADLPKSFNFVQSNLSKHQDYLAYASIIEQAAKATSNLYDNPLTILFNVASDFESPERYAVRDQHLKKFVTYLSISEMPYTPTPYYDRNHVSYSWMSLFKTANENKVLITVDFNDMFDKKVASFEDTIRPYLETAVEHFYKFGVNLPYPETFKFADGLCDFIGKLIFEQSERYDIEPEYFSKALTRFKIVLDLIIQLIMKDMELQQSKFNQRIYLRLLSGMIVQAGSYLPPPSYYMGPSYRAEYFHQNYDKHLEAHSEILCIFAQALLVLKPTKNPAFVFAWLELISHRFFMPKVLAPSCKKGLPLYHDLIIEMFKFLEPFLQAGQLNNPVKLVYKAALKILLILLHDFPEFLCDYHVSLCNVIPNTCIQMRNLILSAFPRHMKLPDPFTKDLKVESLSEINEQPTILSDYLKHFTKELPVELFESLVDKYSINSDVSLLDQIINKIKLTSQEEIAECGTSYNVPLINSIVLHVGVLSTTRHPRSQCMHSFATEVLRRMLYKVDFEGRYLVLNAMVNQLRYPNIHTYYFSCVLLNFFCEEHYIQDQITRVLIERLIVSRPHPWGLLITFIELIKNSVYKFWEKPFIHCSPEIEQMFQNVRQTCN